LPVRFAIDRAGLVGADGPTHAGSFDIGFMGALPGMISMAAADEIELARMVATSASIDDAPSAFRFPRGEATGLKMPSIIKPLEIGKGRIVKEGSKIAILSLGTRLGEALQAAEDLDALGLSTTVADARFIKPLDKDLIRQLADEHEVLITIEEGAMGGFGSFVMAELAESGRLDRGIIVRSMVLPDIFIDHDTPELMYKQAGLDAQAIVEKVFQVIGRDIAETAFLA